MTQTILQIKDGLDNLQQLQVTNVGLSGVPELITNTVPVDLNGNAFFEAANPGLIGNLGVVVAANFVRPLNTTQYSSGQLVANSVTAGSVVPMSLPIARVIGGTVQITRARLTKSSTGITAAVFRAHLYMTLPTPSNGDGGNWLTDQALGYGGSFTFDMSGTFGRVFTDGVKAITVPDSGTMQLMHTMTTNNIYALLEARGSYTPVSGETFTLALEVTQN